MKTATVALVIRFDESLSASSRGHALDTIICDDQEISVFESAYSQGKPDPMAEVAEHRARIAREDDEFGDYVEQLLSRPFVKPEIQEHGVQWLKSRIRVEQFQRTEAEAAKVIGDYAYRLFIENQQLSDFFLSGPHTRVRVRIFVVGRDASAQRPAKAA
jgi:hypothetical protein